MLGRSTYARAVGAARRGSRARRLFERRILERRFGRVFERRIVERGIFQRRCC